LQPTACGVLGLSNRYIKLSNPVSELKTETEETTDQWDHARRHVQAEHGTYRDEVNDGTKVISTSVEREEIKEAHCMRNMRDVRTSKKISASLHTFHKRKKVMSVCRGVTD